MDASWFWVPDDAEGFVAARLVSRNKRDNLVCVSRDGRTLDPAPASACYAIDDVASVDEPPPCDLVLLAEVSPASILHALRRRFEDDDIYTSLGSVLVALNPFKAIDGLYGPAALAHYGGGAGGALAPHVYDVAAAAYRGVRGGDAGSARSQSLVISGESGAGKTETTKHALAYLAFVAGSPGGVQERILAASPILEGLGNAKTSRNDNSGRLCGIQIFNPTSIRFGKFMELRFDASGAIASCGNTPYLLESGRVVGQAPGERNFHAFFQLRKGARGTLARALAIDREVFFYCGLPGDGRGGFDVAGADDAAAFVETCASLEAVGFDAGERDGLLKIVAAVLHLGDASFRDSDGPEDGSAADAAGRDALERAAACLGADAAALERALTLRTVEVKTGRRCSVTKVPLPPPQAAVARDAFARQLYAVPETTGGTPRPAKTSRARLYGALFEWTVGRVNESVGGGGAASSGPVVGVLDIFGFEIFTVNSFEQLLINFANEGLQRLFNRTVFDEEMALYEAEGVGQCVRLDYVDNADVLALLGGRRPPGVVEMLDEESKLPRGSSANFRARLAKRHAAHARFSTPRSASTAFFVEHYAGKVCYEAASFVEKNRDGVTGDMVAAFGDCTLPLVAACFAGRGAASKASVGAKFKKSLDALTATLGATEPHYVRCVKSNPRKAPGAMDYKLCLEQLTYAGVLEAVKIHQRGFPFRLDHVAFRRSYHAAVGLLADRAGAADRSKLFAGPPRAQCEALAAALAARDDAWPSGDLVVGRTRVLYRSGVHRRLEKRREAALALARATVVRALAAATTKRISDALRAAVRALADAMVAWDGGRIAATCDDLDRACASASRGRAAFFGLFLRASYVPAARRMLDFLARRAALDKELGGLLRGELGGDADFQTLVARCGAIEAGVAEAEGLRFRAVALGRVVQGAGPGDSENYGRAVAARDAVARVADVKRSLDLGLRDRDEDRLTAALGALDELRSDGKLAAGLWADDEARARRAAAEIVEQQRALVAEFQSAFASGDGAALASAVKSADEAARTRALSKKTRDARAAARTLLELRDFDARGAWDDAARLAGDDGAWAVGAWAAAVEGERPSRARRDGARDEVAAATVEAHYRAARKALALAPMDGRPDAVAAFDPNAGLDGDEWVDSDVLA
ncbi:myosin heavy chain-like protein [Aureococcus anophagefferens]|uniref:Myosin heavy chain-like protein n=1 Tax=Aureococcus anophagefferens TaxID=44056 RepID=A0ABR1FYK3_AURAN